MWSLLKIPLKAGRPVWTGRMAAITFQSNNVRFLATNPAGNVDNLQAERLKSLTKLVEKGLKGKVGDAKQTRTVVYDMVRACKAFQDPIYAYRKLEPESDPLIQKSNELITKILKSGIVEFDAELLQKIFKLQPRYPTLKAVIDAYYSGSPSKFIEGDVAMIPFRKLVWDADFQRALDYIELTTGNQRYIKHRKELIKRDLGYFGGSMLGLIACIHVIVKLFYPDIIQSGTGGTKFGIYGIYAMIVSYFVNCGFLGMLSFSSKGMENGALMFKHNTMPWDWYQKVDQMNMCAKVLEADAAIHGMDGFATREVVSRIDAMGFDVNEPEQEIMMRQYWYSSGDGFVWCEPDLDPAEIEWWNHLDQMGVKKFWDQEYQKVEGEADEGEDIENEDDADLLLPDK